MVNENVRGLHARMALLTLCALSAATAPAGAWESAIVQAGPDGRLVYSSDAGQKQIPDFSRAGFRGGGVPLPVLPVVHTISPIAGDNTAHIQAAINLMEALPLDADRYRGALLLTAGEYEVTSTLRIDESGVVLRGVGDGSDPALDTIIVRTGTATEDVIVIGGGSNTRWAGEVPGTRSNLTSPFVQVGDRSFDVDDASPYAPGDNVVIYHPCTQAWLDAVEGGGTASDPPWGVDSQPLIFNRYITWIHGNTVTIDAPVYNHLDLTLSPTYMCVYDRAGLVTLAGIEDLRIRIDTAGPTAENHAESAVNFTQVEDGWARNVTTLHFVLSGFILRTATRVTITDCEALEPHSVITGARRYNFNTHRAQLILFDDNFASDGRHASVGNGTSLDSGNVFVDCVSEGSLTSSEGHRRWGMAILFDGHTEVMPAATRVLGLYNRGSFGTGQAGLEPVSLYRRQLADRTRIDLDLDFTELSWSQTAGFRFDVVRGELGALRSGGEDFAASTMECLADDTASTNLPSMDTPPAGEGYWFLVRRVIPGGGQGTYDTGSAAQNGNRDAGIAGSAEDCS